MVRIRVTVIRAVSIKLRGTGLFGSGYKQQGGVDNGYGPLNGVDQIHGDWDDEDEEDGVRFTVNEDQSRENKHQETRIVKPLVLAHKAIEGTTYARQGSDDSTADGPKQPARREALVGAGMAHPVPEL
jgi:hypothetical protein